MNAPAVASHPNDSRTRSLGSTITPGHNCPSSAHSRESLLLLGLQSLVYDGVEDMLPGSWDAQLRVLVWLVLLPDVEISRIRKEF